MHDLDAGAQRIFGEAAGLTDEVEEVDRVGIGVLAGRDDAAEHVDRLALEFADADRRLCVSRG